MTGVEVVRSEMACACRLADIRDVDDLLGHAERLFNAFWSAPMVAGGESPAWSECSAYTIRRWVAVARSLNRDPQPIVPGSPNADGRSRIAHDLRDAGFTSASWQDGPERRAITLGAGHAAALLHASVKLTGGEVQLPPTSEALQAIDAALALIVRYGGIDGAHHKAWVLDQVVRALTADGYAEWVLDARGGEDGPNTYSWDVGTPP